MPTVELLPNSSTAAAPGWHYVLDTGHDPSKIAINPKDRKRAARSGAAGNARGEGELSARQQTAIQRRIQELERDNDPKQHIAVPASKEDGTGPAKTPNVRRILGSMKQIRHWLDDEEALAQQMGAGLGAGVGGTGLGTAAATPAANATASGTRRQSSMVAGLNAAPNAPLPASTIPIQDLTSLYKPPASPAQPTNAAINNTAQTAPLPPTILAPSSVPRPPSPATLAALLAAPPLPYGASHAAAPSSGTPQRHFCDNCGYWGSIRCLRCGARVCGLECRDAHEGTRCLKWA